MLVGNRLDRGCNRTSRESGLTSLWSFRARAFDQPTKEVKQMTTETTEALVSDPSVGATTDHPLTWHQINWRQAERTVRRLQIRSAQATQAGKWGKVKARPRLLTRSFSGKALAVRRVTENTGKRTPGVDGETWKTPEQKMTALLALHQRGYRPQPLRRVYIPKSNGTQRPLSIPIWAAHYPSFQAMFGIPCVLLLVDRELRSTLIVLLYHTCTSITGASLLPLPPDWLAQCCDDLRRQRDPARSQRCRTNTLQPPRLAPLRDRRTVERVAVHQNLVHRTGAPFPGDELLAPHALHAPVTFSPGIQMVWLRNLLVAGSKHKSGLPGN